MKTILVITESSHPSTLFPEVFQPDYFARLFIHNLKEFFETNEIRYHYISKHHITFEKFRFIAIAPNSKSFKKNIEKYTKDPDTEIYSLRQKRDIEVPSVNIQYALEKYGNEKRFVSELTSILMNDKEVTMYLVNRSQYKVSPISFKSQQTNTTFNHFNKENLFSTKNEALEYLLDLNAKQKEIDERILRTQQERLEENKKIEERLKKEFE